MYKGKTIALVIPAFREEKLIGPTLDRVPDLVDVIYVVDDNSPDGQAEVVLAHSKEDPRIHLLRHERTLGPGAGIITGYKECIKENYDIAVVVGGDNQMPLEEIVHFIDPICEGRADYTKGNRFLLSQLDNTLGKMPKIRLIGNWLIAGVSKVASGYYKIMDFVDGYTAISQVALKRINWELAWNGYGYPMDFLIRMNAYGFRVLDIPRTAIYTPGERQSQIKGMKYFLRVSPMLLRGFLWRLRFKYLYRDFHLLLLFYMFAFTLLPLGLALGAFLIIDSIFWGGMGVTGSRSILCALLVLSGLQFLLFAMLFDMAEGKGSSEF